MKNGQIFLASDQDKETIDKLIKHNWITEETIEGVGTVYTFTKKGFDDMKRIATCIAIGISLEMLAKS